MTTFTKLIYLMILVMGNFGLDVNKQNEIIVKEELQHSGTVLTTDIDLFSYIASVLHMNELVSTGALVYDKWVVTTASEIYLHNNAILDVNVRLDSLEYERGGILISITQLELHPYYEVGTPGYDIALICLSHPLIRWGSSKRLKFPTRNMNLPNAHFEVAAWAKKIMYSASENLPGVEKKRMITKKSIQNFHFHKSDKDICNRYIVNSTIKSDNYHSVFCLYAINTDESCLKLTGAPIIVGGVLYGVISSYLPLTCDPEDTPYLVSAITSSDVMVWAHTVMSTHIKNKIVEPNGYFFGNDLLAIK